MPRNALRHSPWRRASTTLHAKQGRPNQGSGQGSLRLGESKGMPLVKKMKTKDQAVALAARDNGEPSSCDLFLVSTALKSTTTLPA
jgi:hypothetical protein